MRVLAHPTVHEWLLYVVNHPLPWLVAELSRRRGPVVTVPVLGTLISDPHVATAVLQRDHDFTKAGPRSVSTIVTQVMGPTALINMDGAEHRALRTRLRDLFAPAYVERLAQVALAEPLRDLQDRLRAGERVDLVAFMHLLTGRVTCRMLGVDLPPDQAAATYAEIVALGERLAGAVRFSTPALRPAQVTELRATFERLIEPARRAYAAPVADPGSIVARLRELGLSFDEVKGVLGTLFLVGTQTTSVALPRAVALLLDTGQWPRLRAHPEYLPHALDETLRCTAPVPITIRTVARDVEVAGYRFRRGTRVVIFTYNAVKSPTLVVRPDRCDITQPLDPHGRAIWYGSGAHFCLGYALAQYELRAVLQALLELPGEPRIERRRYARHVLLPAYARLDLRLVAA